MKAVLFNETSIIGHHGCTLVNKQIDKLTDKHGIEIVAAFPSSAPHRALERVAADILLINGEGSLHHDSKAARAIADWTKVAQKKGIPVILINSIYQDNSAKLAKGLNGLHLAYVRDKKSQTELQNSGIQCGYVPDLSLSWEAEPSTEKSSYICVTDSTLPEMDKVLYAFSNREERAHFLPLKALPWQRNSWTYDLWKRKFRYHLKKNFVAPLRGGLYAARYRNSISDFSKFIDHFSTYKLVVAARYHAVCLSLDLEIPFCAVSSNSWKVEALLEEAGLSDRLIPVADLKNGRLDDLEARYGRFSTEELEKIRKFKADAGKRADQMFREISEQTAKL